MIKYIKSVLWRVAKRLFYIQDARCLKVKHTLAWIILMEALRAMTLRPDQKVYGVQFSITVCHTVTRLFSARLDILLCINQQDLTKAIQSDAIITREQKCQHCVLYL